MGLLNKALFDVSVYFYGPVHEGDDPDEPVRAWVDAGPPPEIAPARDAYSMLLPLLAANLILTSIKGDPGITDIYVDELADGADQILRAEDAARQLTFAGDFGGVPISERVEASEGDADRILKASLMQDRKGGFWSRPRAPMHGGSYFAPVGHLMVIEHAAKSAPYEDTLVPAALGIRVALEMFDAASSHIEEGPSGFLPHFNRGVSSLVLSDDPRAEWQRRQAAVAGDSE